MGETNQSKSEIAEIKENPLKNGKKMEGRDEKGKFINGYQGGPGKPRGTKSFDTLFEEAIKIIVKEQKIPGLKNPEIDLVIKAVIEGLKGNYQYFRDIMDRRFGKPKETHAFEPGEGFVGVIYLPRRKQDEDKQLNEPDGNLAPPT